MNRHGRAQQPRLRYAEGARATRLDQADVRPLPDWLTAEITLRAKTDRLAEEKDRLTRKAAYDNWAAAYGAPMVTIRSLELTEVCQSCGMPYFTAAGHDCPGPRLFLNLLPEETAVTTYAKTYTDMGGRRRDLRVTVSAAPRTVVTRHAGFATLDGLPVTRRALLPRLLAWREGLRLRRDGYSRVA